MATVVRTNRRPSLPAARARAASRPGPASSGIKYITRRTGRQVLDRKARKWLGISGPEFVRRYRAGEVEDLDHSYVSMLAMLIPYGEP